MARKARRARAMQRLVVKWHLMRVIYVQAVLTHSGEIIANGKFLGYEGTIFYVESENVLPDIDPT